MSDYYDQSYFDWQKNIGAFGGWANLVKFEKDIDAQMNVVDFGCGGGFLLKNIACKGKMGVEINETARMHAGKLGVKAVASVDELPDDWADCIISNNALEHVPDPLNQLILLKNKLKAGGKIIFVVPCDSIRFKYDPKDVNYHLYSWSPMNLGNLFTEAGYQVVESKAFIHKWPPRYQLIAKLFGKRMFHLFCRIYGRIERSWFQVRVVAVKK
ncbi:methyltransferase family protein [Breznakibacter xylanolyticus]|uniref:Methyltransferase family protein n=1 Tax=Breznakibacter xylanolyticus TaxID=990 RepID=A0A2W7NKU4_9BACT|nr:class I SAM-dependent methyltransferase [Breznakibacter xylanolyticus]PZX13816.1 methyltransferase family protein [Breznakibacter xylanolyticus]